MLSHRATSLLKRKDSFVATSRRFFGTGRVSMLDEKEKGDEGFYFTKQDEALLKKILEQEQLKASSGFSTEGISSGEMATTEEKVKMLFMQHGIPPSANPGLLKDLVNLVDTVKAT
jgi:hypothetical protein